MNNKVYVITYKRPATRLEKINLEVDEVYDCDDFSSKEEAENNYTDYQNKYSNVNLYIYYADEYKTFTQHSDTYELFMKNGHTGIKALSEEVEVGTDSHTENIPLILEMGKYNEEASFEYTVDIDDVGQIVITPTDTGASFINIRPYQEGDPTEDIIDGSNRNFYINLTANMISETDNFNYFVDIDEIGQAVITPDEETTSFLSVSVNDSLNLVTEDKELIEAVEDEVNTEEEKEDSEGSEVDAKVIEEKLEPVDEEGPYTKEQIEDDLKRLTKNFTIEGDSLKTSYEVEHQYAMEILSKYYEVEGSQDGRWYVVTFKKESLTEAVDPTSDEFMVKKNTLEGMFEELEKHLTECIDLAGTIQDEFEHIGIHAADIDGYMTRYLEKFIEDREGEVSIADFRRRLEEYSTSISEEE